MDVDEGGCEGEGRREGGCDVFTKFSLISCSLVRSMKAEFMGEFMGKFMVEFMREFGEFMKEFMGEFMGELVAEFMGELIAVELLK